MRQNHHTDKSTVNLEIAVDTSQSVSQSVARHMVLKRQYSQTDANLAGVVQRVLPRPVAKPPHFKHTEQLGHGCTEKVLRPE